MPARTKPTPADFEFAKAERAGGSHMVCLEGYSGSGKTYSALLLARGMAGERPIAFIDTEGGRALMYAQDPEIGEFYHHNFEPPYSPERFRNALDAAIALNPAVIIIDSFSHEHEAEGGLLDMADAEAERMSDSKASQMQKWVKPKREHNLLVRRMVSCRQHLILCLRQAMSAALVKDEQTGKNTVVDSMKTICEKSLVYEATIRLEMDHERDGGFVKATRKLPKAFLGMIAAGQRLSAEHGAQFATVMAPAPESEDYTGQLIKQISACSSLADLTALWKTISADDQKALKRDFTARRQVLEGQKA